MTKPAIPTPVLVRRLGGLFTSAFRRPRPSGPPEADGLPVCFIIYGGHSADWLSALCADAPVWRRIPEVAEVVAMPQEGELPPHRANWRTIVLPLMEPHILGFPRERHHALLPSEEAIRILADKGTFADYALRRGLGDHVPKHFPSAEAAKPPCVIKRCNLNGGHGVALAQTRDEILRLRYSDPWRGHPVVLQTFEPSPHQYVTHAVCRLGRIVAEVSYRQTLKDDPSVRRWSSEFLCERVPLPAATRRLMEKFLRPLRYDGPCNVDYVLRGDESVCVFEINPRLGGSLMMPENVDDLATILRATINWAQPMRII